MVPIKIFYESQKLFIQSQNLRAEVLFLLALFEHFALKSQIFISPFLKYLNNGKHSLKGFTPFLLVLREVETFGIRYKRGSKDYENAMKESLKKFLPLSQRATHKVGYSAAIGSLIKQMLSIPLPAYSPAGTGEEKLYLMSWFTCKKLIYVHCTVKPMRENQKVTPILVYL